MISTARSVAKLNASGAHNDVLVLLRTLYEQVVTFCWLAIDSDRHLVAWANEAHLERLRLHNDALAYGHSILTEDEVEALKRRHGMPRLVERAAEVDDFWPSRIPAFRAPGRAPKQLLTMRGLYVGLYRIASRAAHAHAPSVDRFVDHAQYPRRPAIVRLYAKPDDLAPLAVPLIVLALLACSYRLHWPDPESALQLNAALLHDVDASQAVRIHTDDT
jgi:hypothetical protein